MRRYDFVKVGLGEVETDEAGRPIMDEMGKYKTKSELINVSYLVIHRKEYETNLSIDDVYHLTPD